MGLRRKITNSIPFSVLNLFFFSLVYGKDVDFSEKSQLLKLKNTISDPHNMLSTWKSTNHNHCSWFGVTCNSRARVSELKIPGNYHSALQSNRSSAKNHKFLGGKLSNAIGGFLELRVLSIPFNRIIGEFPDEIWGLNKLEVIDIEGNSIKSNLSMIKFVNLKNLHVLNLGFNRLFGEIPNSLANCNGLIRLNLAGNQIQGPIPSFIGHLTKLNTINFSFNRFSGSLPKFWTNCHVLEHIDFSNNFLTGNTPKSVENCTNLRTLLLFSNNFTNNIGPTQQRRSLSDSSSTDPKKKGFSSYELILIIVATFIVVILAILIIAYLYLTHRKKNSRVEGIPSPARSGTERLVIFKEIGAPLTFAGVIEATGNFTSRNCIGSGGFGSTYRAEISPGTIVAVKRLTIEMCQGVPQFKAEIRTLGRIRHPNLITLIGYYASTSEMFLIYNYLSGGSLEDFIRDKKTRVTELKTVHKIALNVASALSFLHADCNPRIIHRDVKPSNILLDDDFNAFLSDFGLSRLLEGFETHVTTGVAGTFGYVAPEYALACRASDRADVYSYGVMLLELISDKRALDVSFSSQENGYTIVSWAVILQRAGRPEEVFSDGLWEVGPPEVLMEMLELGLSCTAGSPALRPAMRQVVRKLREIQSVFDR